MTPCGSSGPSDLTAVSEALQAAGIQIQSAELAMEPRSTVEVSEADAVKLLRLLEDLSEHDDVSEVHANFDIPAEILERIAA